MASVRLILVTAATMLRPVAGTSQRAESAIEVRLGKPAGWAMNAEQVRTTSLSLIAEGQQPMGVKNWISSQLLPQAEKTTAEMQQQVDAAKQQIDACKELMWSAEKEVKHREAILEQDESKRFTCISDEHSAHKLQVDTCDDLQSLIDLVVKNQPEGLHTLVNRSVEAVEEVLRRNEQFVNDFYTKMGDKESACVAATQASEQAHAQCEADEEVIEAFFCTLKYGRDQACARYDQCFSEKVAAFEKTEADVKELEAHTKDQFKKLTCFERGISDGSNSTQCDPAALSVAHLSVSYPMKPTAKPCVALMKTRRDLSSLVECKEGSVIPHAEITVEPKVESGNNTNTTSSEAGPSENSFVAVPYSEHAVAPKAESGSHTEPTFTKTESSETNGAALVVDNAASDVDLNTSRVA